MTFNNFFEALSVRPCPEAFLVTVLLYSFLFTGLNALDLIKTPKQLSRIAPLVTSLVISLSVIPFVYIFVANDGDLSAFGGEVVYSKWLCIFFLTTLVGELTIGSYYYGDQITFLDGWVHHFLYIPSTLIILKYELTGYVLLVTPFDIPTVFFDIAKVNPKYRSDLFFGSSLILFRVLYNFFIIYYLYFNEPQPYLFLFVLVVLPMHLVQFYKFIIQQIRLKRKPFTQLSTYGTMVQSSTLPKENTMVHVNGKNYSSINL